MKGPRATRRAMAARVDSGSARASAMSAVGERWVDERGIA